MKIFGIDLDNLILEAVEEINPLSPEKQRQELKADELQPFTASKKKKDSKDDVDEAEDDEDEERGTSKVSRGPKEKPATVEEMPEISAGKIVKILNQMRSGKSLGDKQVRVDFQKYYNSLDGDERLAFYTFLDAVNKIVTDEEDFDIEDTESPDDIGVDIDVKRKKTKKKKKPDADSSTPIVVGEHADKSKIKRLLRRNW